MVKRSSIGNRSDEDERSWRERKDALKSEFSWRAAKRHIREEEERREQVRAEQRAQRQSVVAPEPKIENGVRQWASPALLKRLHSNRSD